MTSDVVDRCEMMRLLHACRFIVSGEFSAKDSIERDMLKLRNYGEIVREEIFPGTMLVHLFHPDDMETVYRNNGRFPGRGLVNALAKYRQVRDLPPDLVNA